MRNRLIGLAAVSIIATLVAPSLSAAKILEIGDVSSTVKPTCPRVKKGCYAVSRATVYQSAVGSNKAPMVVPASGRLVAWSVRLGTPASYDRKWFDKNAGGVSQAQLTVLKHVKTGGARVYRQTTPVKLQKYFGKTPQFALKTSLYVTKGQILALTVPTWAPVLAYGFDSSMSWKASRAKGQCTSDLLIPHEQIKIDAFSSYHCRYPNSRIAFSATVIPTP